MRPIFSSPTLSRRHVLQAAAVAAPFTVFARRAEASDRPNFVFLMADDMGYADVSSFGRRDYKTPNIDRLAAEGMRLTHAYANSAVCTATRVGLVTGRYQYRVEVGLYEPLGNGAKVGLPPGHPTIASTLKQSGYGTTLIGKWHVGDVPQFGPTKYGYDHFWGFANGSLDYFTHRVGEPNSEPGLWDGEVKTEEHGYLTDLIAQKTIEHIRDYSSHKQPFLLSVHFNAPHWPWEGPEDEAAANKGGMSGFEAGTIKTYGAMVRQMDAAIGKILREVERDSLSRNTVVVFTSDNGGERFSDTWPFTGKKTELLEGGLRIPAIVRWPGHVKAGSVSEQVCMSMDWMPTFVSVAGGKIDPAYPSDGMDLTTALTRGAAPVSRKVFWRYRSNEQRAMRDGNMKWLKINENQFLFDVVADPLERANLRRKQPDVFERMVREYAAWDATMLREDLVPFSYSFNSQQLADHYTPGGGRAATGTGAAKGKAKQAK
ncbi:MAG TPA: sulfatase-like hydrolase/transferase [Bryobacteraceae bacterium]|jgi:arylsulfatase A-like enzyme